MSAKDLNKNIEEIFSSHTTDTCITYEEIVELFEKAPTSAQVKNIIKHAQKYKKCLFPSSEYAKVLNKQESDARRAAQKKMIADANNEDFDIMKERELLEWSRSDSAGWLGHDLRAPRGGHLRGRGYPDVGLQHREGSAARAGTEL